MKKYIFSILPFLITACATPPFEIIEQDLSEHLPPRAPRIGERYRTVTDLLLMKTDKYYMIDKPGGSNPFIEDYLEQPSQYKRIIRYLPAGTEIVIEKYAFRKGYMINPVDAIVSIPGQSFDKNIFIDWISKTELVEGVAYFVIIDERYLEKLQNDPK